MLHQLDRRVGAVGSRNSPQEALREIGRHSREQCSISFQPVSGFGVETLSCSIRTRFLPAERNNLSQPNANLSVIDY
jgi:hypothetical protein